MSRKGAALRRQRDDFDLGQLFAEQGPALAFIVRAVQKRFAAN